MKNLAIVFLLLAASLAPSRADARTDPPVLASWILNTTGETGYGGLPANVQTVRYSPGSVYVGCSGIPAYAIGPWAGDPNIPSNQGFTFRLPRSPVANGGTKTATSLGPIGVWKNGVPVFNAKDAMSYNNLNVWHQNAVVVEAASFDACLGHPAPGGVYHHHQNPRCLYTRDSTAHSPLLGYAFDGFPIYGPDGFAGTDGTGGIVRLRSSYRLRSITQRHTLPDGTVLGLPQYGPDVSASYPLGYYIEDYEYAAGSGDLDATNGRFAVTPDYPAGTYAYIATVGANGASAYPYAVGPSYYGVVASDNVTLHGHVPVAEAVRTYVPLSIAPAFTAPGADTTIRTLGVTAAWSSLGGVSAYRVEFAVDSLFGAPLVDSTVADTSFLFAPASTGSYFCRVLGIDGEASSPWSVTRRFSYVKPGATRWSIVSLPWQPVDATPSALYPSAVSAAYAYAPGTGYAGAETLRSGAGYWIKIPVGALPAPGGDPVLAESVALAPGWNLVGSTSTALAVAAIGVSPPGLATSPFFGYDGSYATTDTLRPGSGYWVRTDAPGMLYLGGGFAAAITIVADGAVPPDPPRAAEDGSVPSAMLLSQNYPNPFNPATTIRFDVGTDARAELRVYDLLGAPVATLVDGPRAPGSYAVRWDGTNDRGVPVNSGVYFCRYRSGGRVETRKMMLLR